MSFHNLGLVVKEGDANPEAIKIIVQIRKEGEPNMQAICLNVGKVCLDNLKCQHCHLLLECYIPIADYFGYAPSSELDCYLCPGCTKLNCQSKDYGNL